MSKPDEEFLKRLRATFHAEAAEHLQAMSSILLELEKSPSPARCAEVIETAYREAHCLKGASRAVDLSEIEAICQGIEGVFSTWKQEPPDFSPELFDTLHGSLDSIGEMVASIKNGTAGTDRMQHDGLLVDLRRLQSQASNARPSHPSPAARQEPPQSAVTQPATDLPVPLTPPSVRPADSEKGAAIETVRIPIANLDAGIMRAEEMLTLKANAAQRASEIRELAGSFDLWWKEIAKLAPHARSLRRDAESDRSVRDSATSATPSSAVVSFLDWNSDHLRSLENKLALLKVQAEQDRRAIANQVDDLLDNAKKLLILPFSTIADVFPKVVRDLCRDLHKEAELIIEGAEIGIDNRILEEMKDPIIHILRNCIDHGVERPEERLRLKKPARATIKIAVSQANGNKAEIAISDDGAGIDPEKVKKAAVARGMISQESASQLDDEQVLPLVFQSGLSTAPVTTAISGRGLGMAIVSRTTEMLGGKVLLQSNVNVGTILRITLPVTLATCRGVLVSTAGHLFVIPATSVERVMRIKPSEIKTVENRETISVQGRLISVARLDAVLELHRKAKQSDGTAPLPVVILYSAGQRIAYVVDEVLREEEVLVKTIGKPLKRVRNVAGATLINSIAVPVLNVTDLMKSACQSRGAPARTSDVSIDEAAQTKRILVVEDSITSRTLLRGILEGANFQVRTAVDGIDAFTLLREDNFDLVVSDVEMPRMSGVDLTAKIRGDNRLSELPVILVTAQESGAERERGIDVGANAHIVKSSFDQSNLLEAIRRLI